jgi:hypothetical protein
MLGRGCSAVRSDEASGNDCAVWSVAAKVMPKPSWTQSRCCCFSAIHTAVDAALLSTKLVEGPYRVSGHPPHVLAVCIGCSMSAQLQACSAALTKWSRNPYKAGQHRGLSAPYGIRGLHPQ